jgi:hypothetical protein
MSMGKPYLPPELGELGAWQTYHLNTNPDGTITGVTRTNDDEDRGYPNTYAAWNVRFSCLEDMKHRTGGTHTGCSGIRVTVYLDGQKVPEHRR